MTEKKLEKWEWQEEDDDEVLVKRKGDKEEPEVKREWKKQDNNRPRNPQRTPSITCHWISSPSQVFNMGNISHNSGKKIKNSPVSLKLRSSTTSWKEWKQNGTNTDNRDYQTVCYTINTWPWKALECCCNSASIRSRSCFSSWFSSFCPTPSTSFWSVEGA